MYEDVFEKVEKVLDSFPIECRQNYYNNKKKLKINRKLDISSTVYGEYNHDKNIITLYRDSALSHELFHMAFRDKKKLRKKLYRGSVLYISNGISVQNIKTKGMGGVGLTEGFAEYLARKCCNTKGHQYLYLFTDLLISIYGEDILYYPLKNDMIGFILDKRFLSVSKLSSSMDDLLYYSDVIKYVSRNSEVIEKTFETNTKEKNIEIGKALDTLKKSFGKTIIELFNKIIDEYNNCVNPKISKDDFINKILDSINSNDYCAFFILDYEDGTIKEEIEKIIESFKKSKIKVLTN